MWLYSAFGAIIAFALAITAWVRSRRAPGAFDGDLYGMNQTIHRRYMYTGCILALICIISFFNPAIPTLVAFAAVLLVAIVYFTSFLRGAESDD